MLAEDLVGKKIGTYRVLRKLGQGGMGAVYLAEHPEIGKRVAIKVLHAEASSERQIVDRFFAEAKAVNVIGHPNIVDIIDLSRLPDGRSYLVMEYLDGATLGQFLQAHARLGLDDALAIAVPLCDGLAAAHERGIVHRDLKPDNIVLVARTGQAHHVKILDFGVAKLTPASRMGSPQATRAGALMGTPQYMSPEQALGKNNDVDARSDVFTVGVLLYRMLSGRLPFEAPNMAALLMAVVQTPHAPLAQHRPDLPPAIGQLVDRALAKRREDRFAGGGALGAALRVLVDPRRALSFRPLPLPPPEAVRIRAPTSAQGVPIAQPPTPSTQVPAAVAPSAVATIPDSGPAGHVPVATPPPASQLLTPVAIHQAIAAAAALPPADDLAAGTPIAATSPLEASPSGRVVAPAAPRRSIRSIMIGVAGGLVLGAAALAVVVLHGKGPAEPVAHASASALPVIPARARPAPPPPVARAAAPAAAPASLPAAGRTDDLTIASTPPGAQVTLSIEGSSLPPLTTPADLRVRDGAHVELTFALAGYDPVSRELDMKGDQPVSVTLAKARPHPVEPIRHQASRPPLHKKSAPGADNAQAPMDF